jgi:hypothetical protein
MSKKLLLSLTIMAGVLFVAVSPALATPLDCSTGRNLTQYNGGRTLGMSIARQAWQSVGRNPDRFEEAADAVRSAVTGAIANLPNTASELVKCRAKGMSQGVCDGLSDIQDEVSSVCFLDGQMWGELSGDIYCALATEFGGADLFELLPVAPTNLCGTNFVEGCTGEFDAYAYALATCAPYTDYDADLTDTVVPPFAAEYASWQGGMCSYEIP